MGDAVHHFDAWQTLSRWYGGKPNPAALQGQSEKGPGHAMRLSETSHQEGNVLMIVHQICQKLPAACIKEISVGGLAPLGSGRYMKHPSLSSGQEISLNITQLEFPFEAKASHQKRCSSSKIYPFHAVNAARTLRQTALHACNLLIWLCFPSSKRNKSTAVHTCA